MREDVAERCRSLRWHAAALPTAGRPGAAGRRSCQPTSHLLHEASLASTRQMRDFLDKIGPQDRVLVIGDTRQNHGVDAGKPFITADRVLVNMDTRSPTDRALRLRA